MILQALNRYYDILCDDSRIEIARFGYSTEGVSFALNISKDGELLEVLPQFDQVQRGRKTIEVPRSMILPARVKRASNVAPNFLWDNAVYVLGISDRNDSKPKYSRDRFDAFRQWNRDLLAGVDNDASLAVLAFLERYDPATGRENPAIANHLEALLQGGNLVFLFRTAFVHKDPDIKQVWEDSLAVLGTDRMQCLVTGTIAPIARLHANLKGVVGTRPGGATLVGFNLPAFRSYNRDSKNERGLNSPVSEKATSAYTTVLNYLLSDINPNKKFHLGDTTVIYWAESENRAYEAAFASFFDPAYANDKNASQQAARREAEAALKTVAAKVKWGEMLDLDALLASLDDENPRFYILGLSPSAPTNAARVAVRFFITDPFKRIVNNIMTHYDDLKIIKEYDNQPTYPSIWQILNETVSRKSQDSDASPLLAGSVLRAVLTGAPYPAALYNAIIIRIRADADDSQAHFSKINYMRVAVIKAFLLRKYRHQRNSFQEVLIMALNEQSTIPAYVLGRLFAVLEDLQMEAAKPTKLNRTIKDSYFTSACTTPASVFPTLLRLSQHHLPKSQYGYVSDNRIKQLLDLLEAKPFPHRLTLDEQGVFVLGYYHQRAAFYVKHDDGAAASDTSKDVPS